ncbi:hypothetical protein TCAL_07821 [Tigriopus californicus]|uniref:SSD domain-containing protein n=1 Tax=Tigriopus californicus TaxID=6832 RepID=A0A553NQ52_TIGCA|nr:hypothetical protein TCAL_07821 [Tigriopus californicus]|eukprot:TCALIF_07821-PA protein Name:"Similar to NPC1 Niemann-Pick C1 protein (Homo sapiens)" AED:0.61 eAED:0.61 QI:0/0.75/0.4/0.8/1/1/5/0/448
MKALFLLAWGKFHPILFQVDMVGVLHFWGLTIDTISCINIVLAIGLCVDYSAHIAHAFIVEEGDRQTRATNSLVSMGPAILNGGITTFLALVLLGFSESHAFITFFKVFLLTVVFGLFHGLVYLPVVLSIMGPLTSHDDSDTDSNSGSSSVMTDSTNGNFKDQQPMNTSGLINDGYVHDEFRLFGGNDIMGPGPLRGHRGGHFIKNELSLSRSPSGPWFAPHAKRKSKTKRFAMGRGESQGKLQINTLDENVSLGSLYGMFPSAGVNGQYNAYGSIAPSANRVFQSRPYQSRNAPILSDWDQMRERERDEPELSNQYEPFYVRNNGSGNHVNFHAYRPSLIGAPEDKEALWSKARYKAGGGPSIGPSERSRASSKQSGRNRVSWTPQHPSKTGEIATDEIQAATQAESPASHTSREGSVGSSEEDLKTAAETSDPDQPVYTQTTDLHM